MDPDILQSTLDDLSHLIIPQEHLTVENDAELGVGGYGEVFLAVLRASDLQIKVAVKRLRIVQPKGVRRRIAIRLARELKVWATAKHPNILELLGFYLGDNYKCAQLVSAYMANGNVKEYINRLQPNLATRLRFVQGIASGMSYLHNCNPAICHGDLKPANVLVNESLDAVLCDFGLARFILESGVSSGLTTSNNVKGATRYMAPELLLEGEAKHTLESDVWAWACTTFEVLTGREPFPDAKSEQAVITAIVLGRRPGSVDLLDSFVSDENITYYPTLDSLKSIIADCWIEDSAKRPSSSEILNRLTFPARIEALDTAPVSTHLSATEDRQLQPSFTDSPTHGNVEKKRKGSPGLEGRLEKLARGEDAAIETEAVRMLKGYGSRVVRCRWNTLKRDVLAISLSDGEVRLWNVPIPQAPLVDPVAIKHHSDSSGECEVYTMEWDCTGARLATGCIHGVLRVWTAEGALQSNLEFHTDTIWNIMWSPRALFLLSAGNDGTLVVWDMRAQKRDKIYQVFEFHYGPIYNALWFDDETLVSCGIDGQIHVCRLQKETPLRTFTGHERAVHSLRLSKDKTLLASLSYDLTIRVWNMDAIEAGALVQSPTRHTDPAQNWVLDGHTGEPEALGWCPSDDPVMQYLLVSTTAFRDRTTRIWDARNGSCIKELRGLDETGTTPAFSPRGRYFAAGTADGRILIYSSSTGTLLFEWDRQSGIIWGIQWQSAGDQLAVGLESGRVAVLDMKKMGFGDYVAPVLIAPVVPAVI